MKIRFLFAWYDLWVGAFWDRAQRRLYVLPLPCVGIVLEFAKDTTQNAARSPYRHIAAVDSTPLLPEPKMSSFSFGAPEKPRSRLAGDGSIDAILSDDE